MRIVFSVLSLLVVVAIVGMLAKKQLGAAAPVAAPAAAVAEPGAMAPLAGTPQQKVQQFQQAVHDAQQARPVDDTK